MYNDIIRKKTNLVVVTLTFLLFSVFPTSMSIDDDFLIG